MTLGQKIRKFRTESGLTQKEVSELVNVTFQTVSKWENDENEPDVSTLRRLSKLFNCTIDDLLSEEEPKVEEEPIEEQVEETKEEKEETQPQTIIIHQRELHVCEKCGKDIPENELVMEDICTRHASRGRAAEYRKGYYHQECLEEVHKERAAAAKAAKAAARALGAKKSFGWGIASGIVALVVSLLVFLLTEDIKAVLSPVASVFISIGIGYAIFAMIYCIVSGSYIGDVFIWCASLSIKFPGLIFSWDIEGIIWVIAMKVLFAILGFLIGVLALIFAIVFSASLGAISFPFVLIYNIHHDYEDTL